jgi:CHAD domain-containing protein
VLPDEIDMDALGLSAEPGAPTTSDRRFYDTFDGRLHAVGWALAHERGRLVLLDAAGQERAGADCKAAPGSLFDHELPGGAMRELVAPVIEMRALLPITRVKIRRQTVAVLDDEDKTVARLHVESPAGLTARLHVTGVRGYDKELARVVQDLEDLGLAPAGNSVVAEAMLRDGRPPGGVSSKPGVKLQSGEPARRAAVRLCRRLAEVIGDNLPGTLADTDTEFLHDLRVAVRRTRALQRELRDVFDPDTLEHHRAEFKWLQAVTGPTRDLDVYLLDFGELRAALSETRGGDLEPLYALLVKRRAAERRTMLRALRSARTTAALTEWETALRRLKKGKTGGPAADQPVEDIAGARITKVYGQMVKAGGRIDDDTPAEALHELRKKGKELRYLLEFFGGLYPNDVAKPMVSALKALQDTLGRFQDHEVQADLIASLGDDIRAAPDGARALMAMGQLVDRLEQQQVRAREEFAERFAAFAAKDQRKRVKATFA